MTTVMRSRRTIWLPSLVLLTVWLLPATDTVAREQEPTTVDVTLTGTLEASTSRPGQSSGTYSQTVSFKFSESQSFPVDWKLTPLRLQIKGSQQYFDDTTFLGLQEAPRRTTAGEN